MMVLRINPKWAEAAWAVCIVRRDSDKVQEWPDHPRYETYEDAVNERNPIFKYEIVEVSDQAGIV